MLTAMPLEVDHTGRPAQLCGGIAGKTSPNPRVAIARAGRLRGNPEALGASLGWQRGGSGP